MRKAKNRPKIKAQAETAAPDKPLRVDLRLPAELKHQVDAAAQRNGLSTNQLLALLAALAVGFDPLLTRAVSLLAAAPLATTARRRSVGRPA